MRVDNSEIRSGDSPNISVGGDHFMYDMIHQSHNKVSFLIPRYDFERFIECTKNDENIVIFYLVKKSELHWHSIKVTELKIYEQVWRNENHFEVTTFGVGKVCDESDIRDMRLSHLLK